MNKKISVSLALTIAIIAMTVTFSVTMILARQIFDQTIPSVQEKESMYSKLAELDKYVRANYYGDIQDPTLFDMISYGYVLGTGDRNATYYTAKQYTELLEVQSGNIVGVGTAWLFGIYLGWGLVGIWMAFALDENLRAVMFIIRWKAGRWRSIKTV